MNNITKRFGVSLSFSGSKRGYIETVAKELEGHLGRARVLYDRFHEVELSRLNLDLHLPNLYKNESELIVIFLSDDYRAKRWCGLEWRAIRQLIQTDEENSIMLISFGDHGDLNDIGIYDGDGYLDIRSRAPGEISQLILQRHQEVSEAAVTFGTGDASESGTNQLKKFVGTQRQSILDFYTHEWLQKGSGVAVIQGFPGAGKTQLASEIAESSGFPVVEVKAEAGIADPSHELLISLSTELAFVDINQLENELSRGDDGNLLRALEVVLKHNRVFIVIDEFQCFFRGNKSKLLPKWQRLIESLNNSKSIKGKLLLISNRQFEHATWNENCVIKRLDGLEPQEAEAFITQLLEERNRTDDIPTQLRLEIGKRLGGNPRAIKTLIGSLGYGDLDELMSFAPSTTETDDLFVSPELLEKFEKELIGRSLIAAEITLEPFMRKVSAYRKPFRKEAIVTTEIHLRDQLIDRFLLEFHKGYYTVHPLAREISITRLREDHQRWIRSHGLAADYYLRHFKAQNLSAGAKLSISYLELRYHLYESERMNELALASCKLADYTLESISVRLLTKPPEDTIVLEERISLISALSSKNRPKRLDYHLALCLKTRNNGEDYKNALKHAWRAVGPNAYYANWLLLIDLEYAVNGSTGLTKSYREAVKSLNEASNLSQIYKLVAELYEKDNQEDKAVEVLEEAIERNLPSGNDSIIRKCAELLEHLDRTDEAIVLLRNNLEIPNFDHRSILYRHCAELLSNSNRTEEAINLIKRAIEIPQMSYLVHCYLNLARYYEAAKLPAEATQWLERGIEDKRVRHKEKLHRRHAEILANQNQPTNALEELATRIDQTQLKDRLPLYHSYAELAKRAGKASDAIDLLKKAIKIQYLSKEPSLYLVCSNLYFYLTDLDNAIKVLKDGISVNNLRDKSNLYKNLADFLQRQGKTTEAIKALEKSEEDSSISNRFSIFQKHSELLEKVGRIEDAIALNEDAISSPALTNKVVIYQSYAKLLFKHGKADQAIAKLKEALSLPGLTATVIIYQTYAKMLHQLDRSADAIELLKTAINGAKMSNIVSLYKLYGEITHKTGDKKSALAILKRGLEIYPTDNGLKKALADLS